MNAVNVYTLPGVVSVDPIAENVSMVRYHGEEGSGLGSRSLFTVTARDDGNQDVSFFGADTKGAQYTPETSRAVRTAMRAIGFKEIHYIRYNRRGQVRKLTIRL